LGISEDGAFRFAAGLSKKILDNRRRQLEYGGAIYKLGGRA
jgi:hypothetical protein